ncbi:MAG: flagellin, partial [Oscillospiraceae bacterium]
SEVDQLTSEIDRIGDATNFNGINLLDGNLGSKLGAPTDVSSSVGTVALTPATAGVSTTGAISQATNTTTDCTLTVSVKNSEGISKDITVTYKGGADAATTATNMKTALADHKDLKGFDIGGNEAGITFTAKEAGSKASQVTDMTSTDAGKVAAMGTVTAGVDSMQNVKGTFIDGSTIKIDGKTYECNKAGDVSKGNIAFVDYAGLQAEAKKNGITISGTDLTDFNVQFDATTANKGLSLQVGDTNDAYNKVTVTVDDVRSKGLGINGLDVSTREAAGTSIQTIKDAINKVSTNRGNLGALQNRLEYAISNLDVTAENMTSANSRIRDTDMAKEMMNYTKMNVLTQAAQAMLAQANQQPQSILQLLQ